MRFILKIPKILRILVQTMVSKNILVSFLEEHGSEVHNMLFGEWNWDDAKRVWQRDAREEKEEEILDLIEKGYTSADIKNHLRKQTRSVTA